MEEENRAPALASLSGRRQGSGTPALAPSLGLLKADLRILLISRTLSNKLLGDPDEGLELRPEVRERLQRSLERVRQGESGIPAEEVAKRAGLVW